jgi:hypothetical protein
MPETAPPAPEAIAPARMIFGEPAFLAAFAAYLIVYQVLCYHGTYTRGDDFAYMESVVESLARGHLFTHDFIGPHNAFLTAASAAVYLLTANFYLATFGLLALFAAVNFCLFYAMFRACFGPWPSAGWSWVTATFPFYLHKSLDYHGALPTLTCFLGALFAFRAGRLALFCLLAALAVSNRQNSLVLFALPLYALADSMRRGAKPDLRPLAYLAVALLGLWSLGATMNVNWFNANLHVLPSDAAQAGLIARQIAIALFLGIGFLSAMNLAVGGGEPLELLRANLRKPILPVAACLAFTALAFGSHAALVWFQTPLIGSLDHGGRMQIVLALFTLASFWFSDRRLFRPDAYLFLAAAYAGISSLRGFMWDYYLAELALLALWIALARRPAHARPLRFAPAWLFAVLVAHGAYAYLYEVQMDKNALADIAFERLERKGALTPERMTGGTFGYMGFKVFTLVRDDHPGHEDDDYTCYVQGDGASVETGLPWRPSLRPLAPGTVVLDSGVYRIGLVRVPWRMIDHGNPAGENVCHGPFRLDPRTRARSRRYPLDNAEWREFIGETRTLRRSGA